MKKVIKTFLKRYNSVYYKVYSVPINLNFNNINLQCVGHRFDMNGLKFETFFVVRKTLKTLPI